MSGSVWIEAALNGPWGRERQPGIPIRVSDIVEQAVAAAQEGAAILHLHAYDESTGRQDDDPDTYARIFEGIRREVDAVIYPTLPFRGSGYADGGAARGRFAHLEALAGRGLLEWAVVDPGSVNFATAAGFDRGEPGFVYLNPEEDIREGLALCVRHRVRPSYAIYEPGFARMGAAAAAAFPGLKPPVYRLMLSEDFCWGFPPRAWALDAYRALLDEIAPGADIMAAGLGVDLEPLMEDALARGFHLRVGLEDARLGTPRTNLDLVRGCVRRVRAAGLQPASPSEVRAGRRDAAASGAARNAPPAADLSSA